VEVKKKKAFLLAILKSNSYMFDFDNSGQILSTFAE